MCSAFECNQKLYVEFSHKKPNNNQASRESPIHMASPRFLSPLEALYLHSRGPEPPQEDVYKCKQLHQQKETAYPESKDQPEVRQLG